jgi:hypothetical protein
MPFLHKVLPLYPIISEQNLKLRQELRASKRRNGGPKKTLN